MSFTVSAFQDMYASMVPNDQVLVDLLVSNGADGYDEYPGLRAYVMGYRPDEVIDGNSIELNDTRCIILAPDLPAGLRHLERRDRVRLQQDGKAYAVIRWDTKTRRVGSILLAVEAQLRG